MKENKEDLYNAVFVELKNLGVKIQNIKKIKSSIVKHDRTVVENKNRVFGSSLFEQEWITVSGCSVPKFLAVATSYLEDYSKAEIGLFRKAGSVSRQRALRTKLEHGGNFENAEPNDVASLLKQWLRELPEPVIPFHLHDVFLKCNNLNIDEVRVCALLLACLLLPTEHMYTLKHLLKFLLDIASNSEMNKMVPHNLAVIMAPNLFSCTKPEKGSADVIHQLTSVLEMLIMNAHKVGQTLENIVATEPIKRVWGNLNMSIASLDCSPATRRNRKNELVSGIRKFVGSGLSPINSLCIDDAPKAKNEPQNRSSKSVMTSGCMKNPYNDVVSTPNRRKTPAFNALSRSLIRSSSATPSISGLKSFGLLRNKQKKKGIAASCSTASSSNDIPVSCSINEQIDTINSSADDKIAVEKVSPVKKITDPVAQTGSRNISLTGENRNIKRGVSECHIGFNDEMQNMKRASSSQAVFPMKRSTPPYLQSEHVKPKSQRKDEKLLVKSTVFKGNLVSDSNRSEKNLRCASVNKTFQPKGNQTIHKGGVIRQGSNFKVKTCNQNKKASHVSHAISVYSQEKSPVIPGTSSNKSNLAEASVAKKSSVKKVDSKETSMPAHSSNLVDTKNVTHTDSKCREPNTGSFKRNVYKSSLKRGRPNSITSGLKSDLCPKYSSESSPLMLRKSVSVQSKSSKFIASDSTIVGDIVTFNVLEDLVFSEKEMFIDKNCELLNKAVVIEEDVSKKNSEKDMLSQISNSDGKTAHPSSKERLICQDKEIADSGLDISSKFLETTVLPQSETSTNVDIVIHSSPLSEFNPNENSLENNGTGANNTDVSLDHFEETWVSAEKFLNIENSCNSDLNPACKRESIIQLMTNNAGKVRDSVNLYNFMSKNVQTATLSAVKSFDSTQQLHCSSSKLANENNKIVANRRMQLRSLREKKVSSQETMLRSRSVKHNIPLRLAAMDSGSSVSHCSVPLKERTNVSSSNEFLNNVLVKNGLAVATSSQLKVPPVKKTLHVKKLARHSYDGSYSKRPTSRTESSPLISKEQLLQSQKENKTGSDNGCNTKAKKPLRAHSLSFRSTRVRKIANVTQKTTNILVHPANDALVIDEWHCDM